MERNSKYSLFKGILLTLVYTLTALMLVIAVIRGQDYLTELAYINKVSNYIIENRHKNLESVKLDEEKLNELCSSYKYKKIHYDNYTLGYVREDMNGENSSLVGYTEDGYIVFICPDGINESELSLEELVSYGYVKVGIIESVNGKYTVTPNLLLLAGIIPFGNAEAKDYSAVYYDEARHTLGDAKTIGNLYEKYGKE